VAAPIKVELGALLAPELNVIPEESARSLHVEMTVDASAANEQADGPVIENHVQPSISLPAVEQSAEHIVSSISELTVEVPAEQIQHSVPEPAVEQSAEHIVSSISEHIVQESAEQIQHAVPEPAVEQSAEHIVSSISELTVEVPAEQIQHSVPEPADEQSTGHVEIETIKVLGAFIEPACSVPVSSDEAVAQHALPSEIVESAVPIAEDAAESTEVVDLLSDVELSLAKLQSTFDVLSGDTLEAPVDLTPIVEVSEEVSAIETPIVSAEQLKLLDDIQAALAILDEESLRNLMMDAQLIEPPFVDGFSDAVQMAKTLLSVMDMHRTVAEPEPEDEPASAPKKMQSSSSPQNATSMESTRTESTPVAAPKRLFRRRNFGAKNLPNAPSGSPNKKLVFLPTDVVTQANVDDVKAENAARMARFEEATAAFNQETQSLKGRLDAAVVGGMHMFYIVYLHAHWLIDSLVLS
jgi:primosomal protein N''